MNDLINFSFDQAQVRVVMRGGDPWFVLADVCRVLDISQTASASRRLDDDERGVLTMHTPSGEQQMVIASESGLYSLILTSRKPEAKQFKKWVTGTVLPSIRKDGRYVVNEEPPRPLTPAETLLQMLTIQVEMEKRQEQQLKAIAKIEQRIEQVEETKSLTSKPQNAESITEIRKRMAKRHGLSTRIVDHVMFQTPFSPKPFAMVRNSHEEAQGSSFAVWMIKDITMIFDRFVKECQRATPTTVTHPYVDGKFKIGHVEVQA